MAFEPDPQGDLIDVTSPSVADPPRLVGNFVIALLVMTVLLAVPLGYVSRRAKAPDFGEPAGSGDGNEDGTG